MRFYLQIVSKNYTNIKKNRIMKEKSSVLELFEEGIIPSLEIKLSNCKVGDIIYLDKELSKPYEILDLGIPFCLILEMSSGFCHLYKGDLVYKSK